MSERGELIHELHKLIKEGATVPKCLRVISERLNVVNMAAIDIFRAVFSLPLSVTQKATGGFKRPDKENTQRGLATFLVLPMVVQNRAEWDKTVSEPPQNWFDSLTCSSSDSIASMALASIQHDADWANVPPAVRELYLTAERSRLALYEYGEIVSRLAERLQLRIDELEREKEERSSES